MKAIRDSGKSVAEFVRDAKENGQKISGLGHRVYKSYDPRAAIARKYLEKIMEREDTQKLPSDERALFAVATELEDIALNDEYFVSRKDVYKRQPYGQHAQSTQPDYQTMGGLRNRMGGRQSVPCFGRERRQFGSPR